MPQPLHLGLIGAGQMGRLRAEAIAHRIPNARILIVADENEALARSCADDFRIKFALKEYHQILASPAIEAVLICAPAYLHAQLIEEAAFAGKHVFCEKPIDFGLSKIDRALTAVEQNGVKLQIGFYRRFDANYVRVRQAVLNGEVGKPELLHIINRDPAPPPLEAIKRSGGLLMDMTIHDFDMARFLMGEEVVEVYAAGSLLVDPDIGALGDIDSALITLRFASGALGTIENSRRAVYGHDQRVEVFGSGGSVHTENWHSNLVTISNVQSLRRDPPHASLWQRYSDSIVAEMRAFIDAVRNNTPTLVNGDDGRAPMVMAIAALKSLEENRPVRLREVVE